MESFLSQMGQFLNQAMPLAFLAAFLAGVLTSFTPCVYPIIPVTVGVIGARSAASRSRGFVLSLAFVLGLALVYATLGLVAALTGQLFGVFTTTPLVYFVVANIFLIFGLSMLGLFEIRLPSILTRPGGAKSTGVLSAFFLGASSAFVATPCTAPVLGAILAFVAEQRNALLGFSLLFVFALGMGFLLVLVGTFTGLLVSLPKSGQWLERVKKFFGLVMIAVAEYFLIQMGRL